MKARRAVRTTILSLGFLLALALTVEAQDAGVPRYLNDRGTGIPTSRFGTYIRRGELLVNSFFAYSRDHDREYQPIQLGFGSTQDYRARYHDTQGQLFIGYGVTDWLAIEFETASIRATFEKSPSDTTATPGRIRESGVGDIEGQLRFRLAAEREGRPELFGYLEVTAPSHRRRVLIGDRQWEFRPGLGLIRGFSWGTMTIRVNGEYNREAAHWDLGEFSIEYLKRLSPAWRLNLAFEGGETGSFDEWDLVSGLRWRIGESVFLKLDNAIGLSPKATDWAPEIGIVVSIPR